jgi:hypothetical protein
MTFPSKLWSVLLAGSLGLGGCAVLPAHDYGDYDDRYCERETVIVTPPPRVEYRGVPPAIGYIWVDGYWNRIGSRQHWVPGYWNPPRVRPRTIVQHPPRMAPHPDARRNQRDAHDRERWRDGERRRDDDRWHDGDRRPDGGRWREQTRDDRRWQGLAPRRDTDRGGPADRPRSGERGRDPTALGGPERVRGPERIRDGERIRDKPRAGEHESRLDAPRPPRIERERPSNAREGFVQASPRPERHPREHAAD